jgi:hypothetical protein
MGVWLTTVRSTLYAFSTSSLLTKSSVILSAPYLYKFNDEERRLKNKGALN